MLNRAMRNAGIRNGYKDITAEFSAFRDFKLKWTRSCKWISFEVSDYLRNAPQSVIESLAETVFAKIGGQDRTRYSEEVCEYLNSERFLRDNQDFFLKRFRGISQTPCEENVNLTEIYMRLVDRRLVERSGPGHQMGIEGWQRGGRTLERPDEDDHCQPEARHRGHLRERTGFCVVHANLSRESRIRKQ